MRDIQRTSYQFRICINFAFEQVVLSAHGFVSEELILLTAPSAASFTTVAWSFCNSVSAGNAGLASAPILPRAVAALARTSGSLSFKVSINAGTDVLASAPIFPSPFDALTRTNLS